MLKVLKFVAVGLGIFIGFLAVMAVILRVAFPPEKLKAIVEESIHQKLHREARIGKVRIGLSGITIDRLLLSEIPSFTAGNFLEASDVRLEWSLRKLWEGFSFHTLFPSQLAGRLSIGHAHNPYYDARNFSFAWDLQNLDPTWGHLAGWAKLRQGPGMIQNIDQLVTSEKNAKLVLMPLLLLQNLDRLGFVNLGLPDLSHWQLQGIEGDYSFQNGTMKIKTFKVISPEMTMDTVGYVELASGGLALDIGLHAPQRTLAGAMDLKMHVSGTLANPKTNLDSLKKKAFRATVKNLLQNPEVGQQIDKSLQKLFH